MSARRLLHERGIPGCLCSCRVLGRLIAGAACFLLAGVVFAGACQAAVSEIEKSYDGKVVSVDVRARTMDIEYPGAKAPVTVGLESVSLEDPTGRLARPEVFKPGTAIRVRVREITTTAPADPSKPPAKDNPVKSSVETVVKGIRMVTAPAANTGGAPAATPAVKPPPTPATTPVATTKPAVSPTKPSTPAVPGTAEVMAGPPQELAAVTFPAGTALVITLAESPQCQAETVTMRLKCYKASTSAPDVQPDAAALFYVTENADLTAGERDLSGPRGTVNFWRDLLESTKTFLPFSGQNKEKGHEVSAAIAKFSISEPWKERRLAITGSLKVTLDKLSPRVMAVVLMCGAKPLSNVLWIRTGPPAPATKPASPALAPAATAAPVRPAKPVGSR